MSESINAEPDIDPQDIIRILLQETQTFEPPTNAEKLARHLGLMVQGFSHSEYKFDLRIRAFLWPSKRIIGVDRKLTLTRRRYSILHEIGHYVLPGHVTNLSEEEYKIVDDDRNLSTTNVIRQEMEANQFAADCLFQLDGFDVYIRNKTLNWNNIQSAGDAYGASFEATARRWIEREEQPCALIVFNPSSAEKEAPLRIMYTVTSKPFRDSFFSKLAPGQKIPPDTLAHRVFHNLEYREDPIEDIEINISGEPHNFPMHLYTNRYRLFGLLTPK